MNASVPTKRLVLGLVVALLSIFQVGYHLSVLNIPQNILIDYLNTSYQKTYGKPVSNEVMLDQLWSFIVAIFSGGAVVGALLTNVVAERYGRRIGLLIVCNTIGIIGSVMQSFAKMTSFEMLAAGRFMSGVNAGLAGGIEVLFLTESAPIKYRGVAGSTQNLSILTFSFLAQVLSLPQILGTARLWPYLVGIGIIPGLLQFPLFLYLHESPKYLYITKNDPESAKRAINFYQGDDVDCEKLFLEFDNEKKLAEQEIGFMAAFKQSEFRKPLLVACVANVAQLSTGIMIVVSYSTSMFSNAGMDDQASQYASIGVSGCACLGGLISVPVIMNTNRRPLLLSGLGLTNCCMLLFMVASLVNYYDPNIGHWPSYAAVVIIVFHIFFFNFGPGPIPWFIAAEMMPQNARSIAMSASVALNWLLSLISALIYLPLENKMGPFVIMLFLVSAATSFTYLWFSLPETRNKSISEISATFHRSVGPLDEPTTHLELDNGLKYGT